MELGNSILKKKEKKKEADAVNNEKYPKGIFSKTLRLICVHV